MSIATTPRNCCTDPVGEGRIGWAEHEERLARVYAARTGAELRAAVGRLLEAARRGTNVRATEPRCQHPTARPAGDAQQGASDGPNRGSGPQRVNVTLGAVVLDLRDLPRGCQLDVVANTTLGKVEVYVSPGTRLIDTGTAWLGKRSTVRPIAADLCRVSGSSPMHRSSGSAGHSVLGHVRVTIG